MKKIKHEIVDKIFRTVNKCPYGFIVNTEQEYEQKHNVRVFICCDCKYYRGSEHNLTTDEVFSKCDKE